MDHFEVGERESDLAAFLPSDVPRPERVTVKYAWKNRSGVYIEQWSTEEDGDVFYRYRTEDAALYSGALESCSPVFGCGIARPKHTTGKTFADLEQAMRSANG